MKSYLNNHNGYTLLITLGIIMMLMIFMFSFTRIAVTQNKQVVKTDSAIVTSALAEMGGEYFKEYVKADIAKRVSLLETEVNAILANHTMTAEDKQMHIDAKILTAEEDMKTYYSSLALTVGTSKEVSLQTGYKLADYEMPDAHTIYYTTQGYTPSDEGELIQVEIHLPEKLMWKSDTPTFTVNSLDYSEYVKTGENDFVTLTQQTANASSSGYEFSAGEFYYFQGGGSFTQGQFNENQGRSLTDIDFFSDGDISFYKHFKIILSTIVTENLFIEFQSNAQGEITDSTIVTSNLTINKGQQDVLFKNSYICFTGTTKPSNLSNSTEGLLPKLDFMNNSRIVYSENNATYVLTADNQVALASQADLDRCSPTISGKKATYGYESFKSEEIDYESVIYN